ncbi:MAG: hypothetical protein ACPGR8_16710, partial [Limisphaerales bacterium]
MGDRGGRQTVVACVGAAENNILAAKNVLAPHLATGGVVRCVHAAGLAAALALCVVDDVVVRAAGAVMQRRPEFTQRDYVDMVLPPDAHTRVRHRLILCMHNDTRVITQRQWRSKALLVDALVNAMHNASAWGSRAEPKV